MADSNTLRILSWDGGGGRGLLPLHFFIKFCQLWGIEPTDIWKKFDVITGTSVGAIIALGLAFGLTPDEMLPFFTNEGKKIFSLSSLIESLRPNEALKLAAIVTDIPFYQSSGITGDNYGHGLLYKTLENKFKIEGVSATLQDLKTNVVIPSYEADTKRYVLFSNLNYAEYIGQNELISNVAKATSAAPAYLPPFAMNGHLYDDGGVFQNNSARFGATLGKRVKPTANRVCVFSLGTGIGQTAFDAGVPGESDPPLPPNTTTIERLFNLFEVSSIGGQESVDRGLYIESFPRTLSQLYYYRFQPVLDPTKNTELDNTDDDIQTYYEDTATEVFNNDITNINTFLGHLTA